MADSSNWYDPILGAFKDGDDWDWGKIIGTGGGIASALGLFDSGEQRTGYQGKIPNYVLAREQLERRPEDERKEGEGAQGRRYFTQPRYGKVEGTPEERAMTLAEAEAATQAEKAQFAEGGIASLSEARYLNGKSDGMADEIPASIEGEEPAALSDGEFVIPADVVSHLGNGNSEAGAEVLYAMMERIRKARTGRKQQGKKIDPNKMLPV